MRKAGLRNSKSANTLSQAELERIRVHIGVHGSLRKADLQFADQMARQQSQRRIINWNNTIYTLKQQKQYNRYKKFEDDELERRRVDQEERKYRMENNQRLLEKANRKIFQKQARTRRIQSKLLEIEQDQHRRAQLEERRIMNESAKMYEMLCEEKHKGIQDREDCYKAQQYEDRTKLQADMNKTLKKQVKQFTKRIKEELAEERLEGLRFKHAAEEDRRRAESAARQARAKDLELHRDRTEVVKQKQQLSLQQKQRVKQEDQSIRVYEERKDLVQRIRKERAELAVKERERLKQGIFESTDRIRKQKEAKEKDLAQKEQREQRQKQERVEQLKAARLNRQHRLYMDSLQSLSARHQIQRQGSKADDTALVREWKQRDLKLDKEEAKLEQTKQAMMKEHCAYLQGQLLYHAEQRENKMRNNMEEEQKRLHQQELEERRLREWANSCAAKMGQQGYDVRGINKVIRGWDSRKL